MEPLLVAEDSEENPAPTISAHVRFKRAAAPFGNVVASSRSAVARATVKAARIVDDVVHGLHRLRWILAVLLAHGVLIVFLYFYAQTEAYPLPRGVINHTYRSLQTVEGFSYLFGILLGMLDASLLFVGGAACVSTTRGGTKFFSYMVLILSCMAFAGLLFLSPLIAFKIASGPAFKHACDDFWMTVLLTGHKYGHTDQPNYAEFALSTAPGDILFTFSSNANGTDFGVSVTSNATVVPALRRIAYDFVHNTISGFCYDDVSSSTSACVVGTVDPSTYLTFDLSTNGTRSVMRTEYDEWTLQDVPSVIMHSVNPTTNNLGERLLQTSVDACERLKVCVDHNAEGRVLRPDILVAIGWILYQQATYAVQCTTPSS